MFLAAKILEFATQPLAWAMLLLCTGLVVMKRWQKWGLHFCRAALVVLVLSGWQLPADFMLRQLENQSPPPSANLDLHAYEGIVLLGGALEDSDLWQVPGRIALKSSGERMIVPVALLQRNPQLKLLFTGGEGNWSKDRKTESDRAKIFFDLLSVDASRVLYEAASTTTYENAVLSAKVPGVDIKKPWLLLTTAAHMPRSLAVFRTAGWNVTPYSVDYRTAETTPWMHYSLRGGAEKWHYALHEIIGYGMYWITGRI